MSDAGTQIDKLLAIAVVAIPGIATERGIRVPDTLNPEELPRVFAYDPGELVTIIEHQQEEVETHIKLLFVFRGETQESVLLKLDTFRENLKFDPTLTGSVDHAYISERGLQEHPETDRKDCDLLVITLRDRF